MVYKGDIVLRHTKDIVALFNISSRATYIWITNCLVATAATYCPLLQEERSIIGSWVVTWSLSISWLKPTINILLL